VKRPLGSERTRYDVSGPGGGDFDPNCCLAKSRKTSNGVLAGHTVREHCLIVGEVAKELIHRMPQWLRRAFFPPGSALVAAAHDIGKVSPTFQLKISRSIDDQASSPPGLERYKHLNESSWGGHAGVSELTLSEVVPGKVISSIAGLHHGFTPNVRGKLATDAPFGGEEWQRVRLSLLAQLSEGLQCKWPDIGFECQARVIAGLTTVSDWIGSGSHFENPAEEWRGRIRSAVDEAGFVAPSVRKDLSFEQVFGFRPFQIQEQFYGAVSGQGVYVLEAPMGLGKTEAALYAAYLALSHGQATGLYFALPTQLTSEMIHERVGVFLSQILATDSEHPSPKLLHGNAWLREQDLGEEGRPGCSWFNARKRGILAPFAVGTIDQALMAVMNVRHGFVRAYGLAGKVVILDEVHSYDAYTGLLLEQLVSTLRKLHCTVIILSATLTQERRQELLGAPSHQSSYPLISAFPKDSESARELLVKALQNSTVKIQACSDDREAVEEALNRAESGEQVLWIENSVQESQQRFLLLSARASELGVTWRVSWE